MGLEAFGCGADVAPGPDVPELPSGPLALVAAAGTLAVLATRRYTALRRNVAAPQ
jgi:hypothetical protein